jgi:hypothetical protein
VTTQTEPREQVNVMVTLAVIAAVASVILTMAAFWLSYEHLHDVASRYGLGRSAVRSWAWPATVDLFILIGEVLILRAALARLGIDPWAIALTVVGSGGSIALNVAGVGSHAQPMDYVVAAVPPIAALLAFGALMRQLHGALAARIESAPVAPRELVNEEPRSASIDAPAPALEALPTPALERPEPTPQSAPQDAPEVPAKAPQTVKPERPQSAPKAQKKAPRKAAAKRPQSATRADAKAAIEALYDKKKGRPLESEMTAALIALKTYPHASRQHANKLRAEVERERPDLAALGSDNVYALTGS